MVAIDPDTLANMAWEDFQAGLKESFEDLDKEISLYHKLQNLCKITSIQKYAKVFYGVVFELGSKASDEGVQFFIQLDVAQHLATCPK